MNPVWASGRDQGVSLPLVLGAVLLFSALALALSGVANLTVSHNRIAQQRGQVHAAAEAGANDFINRLNAYSEFDTWSAAKVKRELDKGTPMSSAFPKIVRESGFGQWIRIPGTFNQQFTYDIVSKDTQGLIIRSTGRMNQDQPFTRSVEFRVARRSKGDTAVAVERPYVNTVGYAYVRQVRDQGYSLGGMASGPDGGALSLRDYETNCGEASTVAVADRWMQCFRPAWHGFDKVSGDLITGSPLSVHGQQGYLTPGSRVADWPEVTGTVEIVGGNPNQPAVGTKMGTPDNAQAPNRYSEQVTRQQLRPGQVHVGDYTALTSPPARFKDIRRQAARNLTCRFVGATQVVMFADDIYVRSPHTPPHANAGWAPWCHSVRNQFSQRSRTTTRPDIGFTSATGEPYLLPRNTDEWVKLSNVRAGAVFVIEHIQGTNACSPTNVGDNDGIGNYTGVGFPANRDDSDPLLGTTLDPYNCRNGDLFIDGVVARSRTFAAEDNVYLTGGIRYSDRAASDNAIPNNSDDVLGVVAQRNVFIYNPPSRECNRCGEDYYRFPRSPYPLPVLEKELGAGVNGAAFGEVMPWTAGEQAGYRTVPTELGPADRNAIRGKIPRLIGWHAMPQFDGIFVAETGAFMLENPLMHNRPALVGPGNASQALSAIITGAVYSRYAPLLHIDYETASGEVNMYGLHGHYMSDPRLARTLPPGFNGLSVTMYRLTGMAEVGTNHLTADHQYAP